MELNNQNDPNDETQGEEAQEELEVLSREADEVVDVAESYVEMGREMARKDYEALQEADTGEETTE